MNHTHSENCGHVQTGVVALYDGNRPYSAALIARDEKDDKELGWTVASVMARSDEEARELALDVARLKWPAGEGWRGHEAMVISMVKPCSETV